MEKVKVGVVGLRRGCTYLRNFLRMPNVQLIGVADRQEGLRSQYKDEVEAVGGKVVPEFHDLLELGPDAVMVATNGRVHAGHSIEALRAGCHVLCEIPTAYHEHELIELRDVAEASDRIYMVAENLCFMDFLRYWRKWLMDGRFGEVTLAHCEYVHYLPKTLIRPDGTHLTPSESEAMGCEDAVPTWRADQPPIQYLTHDLGPLLELFDDRAVSVTCMSAPRCAPETPLRSDGQIGLFKTEQGRLIQCTVTLSTKVPGGHRFRIFGTEGGAEHFGYEGRCRVFFGGDTESRGWQWTRLGVAAQDDDVNAGHGGVDLKVAQAFVEAILAGRSSPIDVYRGIDYTLPGIIANRSADQGGLPLAIPDMRPEPFKNTAFWEHFTVPEHAEPNDFVTAAPDYAMAEKVSS